MTNQTIDFEVNLKVGIPNSIDRALEEAAFKKECTKKALVEQALRAFLKIPSSRQ
jgi:hypothetical protein